MSEDKLQKPNFTDKVLWIGFVLAVFAAVAVAWNADKDANESYSWSNWITHTQDVLGVLEGARGNSLSALAAIQNYYQSGDLRNLDTVSNAVAEIKRRSVVLLSLTAG